MRRKVKVASEAPSARGTLVEVSDRAVLFNLGVATPWGSNGPFTRVTHQISYSSDIYIMIHYSGKISYEAVKKIIYDWGIHHNIRTCVKGWQH